jgi:hypothetical protein
MWDFLENQFSLLFGVALDAEEEVSLFNEIFIGKPFCKKHDDKFCRLENTDSIKR